MYVRGTWLVHIYYDVCLVFLSVFVFRVEHEDEAKLSRKCHTPVIWVWRPREWAKGGRDGRRGETAVC